MKKVLYITPGCFDKGGISRYSRYQMEALRSIDSLSVKTVSLLGPDEDAIEEEFEVDWHASGNNLFSQVRLAINVLWISIRWQPKVIHVAHVNFSGLAWLASIFCRAKVILNVYGLEIWSGLSWDARFGLKKIHRIISDCHYTKEYMVNEKMGDENTIDVIWDCVDHQKFFPAIVDPQIYQKYQIPADRSIILTLGRLSHSARHKGYERLLQAFGIMLQKVDKVCLVFAGRGDYLEELKETVSKMGLAQNVVFTGSVDEQDLPDIYRIADVFSLVSDRGKGRGEGIPLTPLEAMACGKPVIVGNHDGSQEAVIDQNGYVIDPFDIDGHAHFLALLLTNKDLFQQQSEKALEVSAKYFSFQSFRQKHGTFYNRL